MSAIKKAALSGTTLVIQRRCRKIPAAEKYSKHHCLLVCLVQNGAIGRQNVGNKTEDGGGRRVNCVVSSKKTNWSCGYRID